MYQKKEDNRGVQRKAQRVNRTVRGGERRAKGDWVQVGGGGKERGDTKL